MSTLTEEASTTKCAPTPSTFDLWAEVYDTQSNPFLSLEERILSALLPELNGLDVLDAGCGTGRLLGLLKSRNAHSVIGVDSSQAMLERARLMDGVDVRYGSCTALPIPDTSIDCVVSSFVLSYISDLDAFTDELLRVTRPGATVLLSDVHPGTARALHWKRSFRLNGQEIEIASEGWQIDRIRDVFVARGFRVRTCVEPAFASPEQNIFSRADREESFIAMQDFPAVYILEFVRESRSHAAVDFSFDGARCAFTSDDASFATLTMRDGRIEGLDSNSRARPGCGDSALDLSGYLLLPGIINAHDHLEFGLFPRLGHGPYANAAEWAGDIHRKDAAIIALHRSVPRDVRIAWGAIRNLLSGVTTVCHHNPLTPSMLDPDFPVTVLQNFRWAHSLSVDGDLAVRLESSVVNEPFIVHAAEGVDTQSSDEFYRLIEQGALHAHTVIVHGLAIPLDAIAQMNDCGAALIACPSSNSFLFDHVPAPELITGIHRVALGSDSPLTAVGDLLDELRFTHLHMGMNEGDLYRMVTSASVRILHLSDGEGSLAPRSIADFIATQDRGLSPAATLAQMSSQDVELVVRAGRVFLASSVIFQRLPEAARVGLEPLVVGDQLRWIRAPLADLFGAAAPVMNGNSLCLAGKKVTYGRPA
jgi:cytosine/adenosine deaminase-related metal-dependent hydrolase/ubiquinone/menaquinone biosynthesis C-methylase UbiE